MFFRQLVRDETGCASYVIGSQEKGACVVVDPGRDVEPYLSLARDKGFKIGYVVDTHAHADHISGARALVAASGAVLCLHQAYEPRYEHRPIGEDERMEVGEASLRVIHAPGHRPDNICLAVSDTSRAEQPWMALTGDSLFIGDVARPDLGVNPGEGAEELYRTLHEKLLPLGDAVEVYPAHVAGSACGRAMSAKGVSTIGFERRFNLALQAGNSQDFARNLLRDLPSPPANFRIVVAKNLGQLPLRTPNPVELSGAEVAEKARRGTILLDIRSPSLFGAGYVDESLNVSVEHPGFASSVTAVVPPEEPVVLVVESVHQATVAYEALQNVGLDYLEGYLLGSPVAWQAGGLRVRSLEQLTVQELRSALSRDEVQLLDVRSPAEWEGGHVYDSRNLPVVELLGNLAGLDTARPLAFICNSGYSSAAAASMLKSHGFERVLNVIGGMHAWRRAGFEVAERRA